MMVATVGRVGMMSLGMLAIAWMLLGEAPLTDRQRLTFGVTTIALAWIADRIIGLAIAPPPQFEEEEGEDE